MTSAYVFDFMGVVGYARMAVSGDPGSGSTTVVMYDEIVDALKRLRSAGYRLALVSNNDRSSFYQVAPDIAGELEKSFDVVVYSSDAGYEKPALQIYEFALSRLGVNAGEAHYFDDIARNVDAAIALGMSGTVVTSVYDVLAVIDSALET